MRHSGAYTATLVAALMASAPVCAQDSAEAAPQEAQQASPVDELLEMMRGLPDLQPEFDTSKPVVGIGFQIVDGEVVIARVMEGSAAEAAGLRTGMIMEKINGVRLSGFSLKEIAKLIAAIDGELTFAIRDSDNVKLRKAPIEEPGS